MCDHWSHQKFKILSHLLTGVIIGYNLVTAVIHFYLLDMMGLLRVPVQAEIQGLDIIKHNEPAYGFGTDGLATDAEMIMRGTARMQPERTAAHRDITLQARHESRQKQKQRTIKVCVSCS